MNTSLSFSQWLLWDSALVQKAVAMTTLSITVTFLLLAFLARLAFRQIRLLRAAARISGSRMAHQTVQRTGASRFAQGRTERHRRLAPVADLCGRLLIVPLWPNHFFSPTQTRKKCRTDPDAPSLTGYT